MRSRAAGRRRTRTRGPGPRRPGGSRTAPPRDRRARDRPGGRPRCRVRLRRLLQGEDQQSEHQESLQARRGSVPGMVPGTRVATAPQVTSFLSQGAPGIMKEYAIRRPITPVNSGRVLVLQGLLGFRATLRKRSSFSHSCITKCSEFYSPYTNEKNSMRPFLHAADSRRLACFQAPDSERGGRAAPKAKPEESIR